MHHPDAFDVSCWRGPSSIADVLDSAAASSTSGAAPATTSTAPTTASASTTILSPPVTAPQIHPSSIHPPNIIPIDFRSFRVHKHTNIHTTQPHIACPHGWVCAIEVRFCLIVYTVGVFRHRLRVSAAEVVRREEDRRWPGFLLSVSSLAEESWADHRMVMQSCHAGMVKSCIDRDKESPSNGSTRYYWDMIEVVRYRLEMKYQRSAPSITATLRLRHSWLSVSTRAQQ